jgi:hypothetical protein
MEQEEEADWLGGCLLLSRELLIRGAAKGMTAGVVADMYQRRDAMATLA